MAKGDYSVNNSKTVNDAKRHSRLFKVIVIGDMGVGKTCITSRFCGEKFQEKTTSTIGFDFREKTFEVDGETVKLQLWDTAGQERFRNCLVQQYYHNVHGVIFVYDVTQRSSFNNLYKWIEECDEHNVAQSTPRILIGNKCDLNRRAGTNITVAQQFAGRHDMPLFMTSAKHDGSFDRVETILVSLVDRLMGNMPVMPSTVVGFRYVTGQDRVFSIHAKKYSSSDDVKHSCIC